MRAPHVALLALGAPQRDARRAHCASWGASGVSLRSFGSPRARRSDLGLNFLTGALPAELARLAALTSLAVDNNFLSGQLPAFGSGVSSLALEGNGFDGSAPLPAAACAAACASSAAFACPARSTAGGACVSACAQPAGCRAACAVPTTAAVAASSLAQYCAAVNTGCFECTAALFQFFALAVSSGAAQAPSDARQLAACMNAQLLPFLAAGGTAAALSASRQCAFQRRTALTNFTCPVAPTVRAWSAAVQPCTLTAAVCEGCSSTLIEVLRGAGLKVNPLGLTFTVDNYELVANCLAHHASSILAAGVNPVNFALGFAVCPGPTPGWYQWESSRVSALAALAKIDEERATKRRAVALGAGLGGGCAGLCSTLIGVFAFRRHRRRQADAMRDGAPAPATRLLRSDEVTLFDLIGSGGYASVYRGDWRGASVAVKCFSPTLPSSLRPAMVAKASAGSGASLLAGIGSSSSGELSTSDRVGLLQELRVLSALRHPNVCALYGAVSRPPMLVIELAPAGSLAALLERASLRSLPWRARVATIGAGVACGVEFLHSQSPPVIHSDLKSANVVLTSELVPKLCDFGLSRVLPALRVGGAGVDANSRRIGTPRFMAPELVLGVPVVHAEAIDAYGAGVVLYDLAHLGITGVDMMAPATASSVASAGGVDATGSSWGSMGSTAPPVSVMLARMRSSFAVDISPLCPAPLADVIQRLLAVEPADRPDIAEVRLKLLDMLAQTDSW